VCNGARVIVTTCGACDGTGLQATRRRWITNATPCLICLGTRRWRVECGACAGTGRTTIRPLR
jgi:DnaJ-class molecular chaperone